MGSDNPPDDNNKINNPVFKNQYSGDVRDQRVLNSFRQRLGSDPQNVPLESEKLQPIRRHSNIRDSANYQSHISSKNVMTSFHNSFGAFPPHDNNQLPTLAERNQNRKMSQQYCADFKKSYMSNSRNIFFNHLADSLNHGTAIPREELEKFKEEYIPKYFFDWRNIQDPKTGIKYWKNFGKVQPEANYEAKMKKLGLKSIVAFIPFFL